MTDNADDVRIAIAEDLATAGQALAELRQEVTDELLEKLAPPYKRNRFRRAVAEARAAILRAMDCLMPGESPTTEAVLDQLIERWRRAGPIERETIKKALRDEFTGKVKEIPT